MIPLLILAYLAVSVLCALVLGRMIRNADDLEAPHDR